MTDVRRPNETPERDRRARERLEARLDDPAFIASEAGQRYLEQWRAEHRRHRRTEA